jgi:hypothetical protein
MSLTTTIAKDGYTFTIKSEFVELVYTRMPTQAGLPGVEGTAGDVITIDLGVSVKQISMSGFVDVTPSDGTISMLQLEGICDTWWAYGDDETHLPVLTLPNGSYYVALKIASFRMEAAKEAFWTFSLTWVVRSKV